MRPLIALVLACAFAALAPPAQAAVKARGSVEQVQVTGAKRGAKLALVNRKGRVVKRQRAGRLGGAVFRAVKPGKGYRVRAGKKRTKPLTSQKRWAAKVVGTNETASTPAAGRGSTPKARATPAIIWAAPLTFTS